MDVIKSVMMAFWEGLNLPYQMSLMLIFPDRSEPLWYFRSLGWSGTSSLGVLAAIVTLISENNTTKSCGSKLKEAISYVIFVQR